MSIDGNSCVLVNMDNIALRHGGQAVSSFLRDELHKIFETVEPSMVTDTGTSAPSQRSTYCPHNSL